MITGKNYAGGWSLNGGYWPLIGLEYAGADARLQGSLYKGCFQWEMCRDQPKLALIDRWRLYEGGA